jgi:hypothetical protein
MKTLVIHPLDNSTLFLSDIYQDEKWLVIDNNPSTKYLVEQIKLHDRIVMLGHGTEEGLLGFGRFIINSKLVYLLRSKFCVCIWCNADKFVEKYKLHGFYTGMIISEVEEALDFCITATNDDINHSNNLFSAAIKNSINTDNFLIEAKKHYVGDSAVIQFNKNNIYYK